MVKKETKSNPKVDHKLVKILVILIEVLELLTLNLLPICKKE